MKKDEIKFGTKLTIHCYKHNGKLHRIWDEATVLSNTEEVLICANNCTMVTENDGRSHKTTEPAILFFYKKHWFNVIAQLKPYGLFYYCNIATPYLIDEGIIKYIDYDLDLRVFPDGGYRILDKNEYKYHKKIMNYSREIDLIVQKELDCLIKMKEKNIGPFNGNVVSTYYELYKKLKNF